MLWSSRATVLAETGISSCSSSSAIFWGALAGPLETGHRISRVIVFQQQFDSMFKLFRRFFFGPLASAAQFAYPSEGYVLD